tara:strand:+ start:2229 stop:2570 length:342 start_codon:yes stop_codon:yes gene_type:complete
MTGTDPIDQIDALVVARRILTQPRTFRLSTHETLALAGCLLGLDQIIDELETRPAPATNPASVQPATNARLAAAIARFVKQHEAALRKGAIADSSIEAFHALKTVFEEEFPHA